MLLGAHVPSDDPLGAAEVRGAEAVQIFLSDPRGWKRPPSREDAATLRVATIPIYVHAPYVINVATTNNRVRHPSRQNLQQTVQAAAEIDAAGVVVHGGYLQEGDDPAEGVAHWRTTLERVETEVPLLIENTAGGDTAITRHISRVEQLWEEIAELDVPLGFCLDTCHLHAAGEDLVAGSEQLREIVGGIDLVHVNDSRDEAGSGRDRHESLGEGCIDEDALVEAVRRAEAPAAVVETPDTGGRQHRDDLQWLRARL